MWLYSCVLNAIPYQARCVWKLISLYVQTGWCSILDFSAPLKTVTVINHQVWICHYNGRFTAPLKTVTVINQQVWICQYNGRFIAALKTVTVINQQVWICQYNGRFILFVQMRIQDHEISVVMSLTTHRKSQLIYKSGEKLNGWQYTKSTARKVTHFWLLVIAS